MRDRPVAWRLLAVSALAIAMGLVFGGLRVASAANSAASFSRVSQLANLGQQVTVLVQALENERDQTAGITPINGNAQELGSLQTAYDLTNAAAANVRALAAGIGGSFPANIQARVASVQSETSHLPTLRLIAQNSQSVLSAVAAYATPIADMISLNDQIAQGTSDAVLANEVQTLNALSLAKDEASQQRGLMFNALKNSAFADGELQALETAQSVQATDQTAFTTTATPAERAAFFNDVGGPLIDQAQSVETYILDNGAVDAGTLDAGGFNSLAIIQVSFTDMSATIRAMQTVEQQVAGNIVARAQVLQQGAVSSAVITSVLTVLILLIVAVATLLVTRSLVIPLRRLQSDALNIATVQLPERVRRLGESADAAASLEVVPIDVTSGDEIGRVARAFDQVHAEAVRLAGNEALLRSRYNAMFVNLSRRSQSLIERLVRMIDSLEQNEEDPGRLSNLFSMDHLVTRMRRNSENLLLLAGHDTVRKWSEPVPLTDVARAAISEIEHYSRVALNIQQGVSVAGAAASDVVHLLSEVIENATTFSPRDTLVQMTAQEVSSGGVLVEVVDSGVGVPDETLAEINERLDNPPVMDVSVSRHMGLFAVGRLAERHGIRVRLRARSPQGIIAMVWLPDSILQESDRAFGRRHPALRQIGVQGRRTVGVASRSSLAGLPGEAPALQREAPVPQREAQALPREVPTRQREVPVAQREVPVPQREATQRFGTPSSRWFSDPRSQGDGGQPFRPPEQPNGGTHFPGAAAQVVADPVYGEQTTSGLPMRVPRANLVPGSIDGGRRADTASPGYQSDRRDSQPPTDSWQQRTPEVARSRMSGFQRGVRRGQRQVPRAGEGIDR